MSDIHTNTPQDDTVAKEIRDNLATLIRSADVPNDTLERIQQQLAAINSGSNLKPDERLF